MLLCAALSMQTMLNNQNNIKQLVTHTKQGINIHARHAIFKTYKGSIIHNIKQGNIKQYKGL